MVAIEIKGGADKSNICNRLGEAEKSHQSAKRRGFVEFWTIYNVANLNLTKAREKSPTTNRFYSFLDLSSPGTEEFADFRDRLVSLLSELPRNRRGGTLIHRDRSAQLLFSPWRALSASNRLIIHRLRAPDVALWI